MRNNLKQVSYNAVIRTFKDRSGLIAVHCDDDLRILHSCLMLNSTGDTKCNIDTWVYGLTGLSHLMVR